MVDDPECVEGRRTSPSTMRGHAEDRRDHSEGVLGVRLHGSTRRLTGGSAEGPIYPTKGFRDPDGI